MECRGTVFAILFTISVFFHGSSRAEDKLVEGFDVKPGGVEHTFEKEQGSFKCAFTYVAQGGTNEKWELSIESDKNAFACTVVRPQGTSYLFFQSFKMRLSGGKLEVAEVVGNQDHPLGKDEYVIDTSKNEVRSSNNFKSQMAMLTAVATSGHSEL